MIVGRVSVIRRRSLGLMFSLAAVLAVLSCVGTSTRNSALDKNLIEAAKSGDLTAAKDFLARGASVDARDSCGRTALLWALWQGKYENGPFHPLTYFKTWAEANAVKPNHPDERIRSKRASSCQHGEIVKLLLHNGAHVNLRYHIPTSSHSEPSTALTKGSTALIWPVVLGHADLVKQLLDKGADVDAKLSDGSTALMWAAMLGDAEVAKMLKAHGADEPLNIAAMIGDKGRVQELLQAGADPNARDGCGRTALMEAIGRGAPEIARELLEKGADPNAGRALIRVAFKDAACSGEDPETRVKIFGAGPRGYPLLIEAIRQGNLQTLKVLLDCGTSPYASNRPAWTALMEASSRGNLRAAQLLLANGAQVNARNLCGETALKLAADCGATEVVKLLVDKGADINAKTSDGLTVLMWAVLAGQVEVVKLLLDHRVEVNAGLEEGSSALLWAAVTDRREIVELLTSHGAEVSLSIAVVLDDEKKARRLLESGVDPNSADVNGWTPLMNASWRGNETMMALLKAYGAKERIAPQHEYGRK